MEVHFTTSTSLNPLRNKYSVKIKNKIGRFFPFTISKISLLEITLHSTTDIYINTSDINQTDKNAFRKLRKQNVGKKSKFCLKSFVQRNFPLFLQPVYKQARMAELVDALDSKSSDSNIVPVRFRLRVQTTKPLNIRGFVVLFFWKFQFPSTIFCSIIYPLFLIFEASSFLEQINFYQYKLQPQWHKEFFLLVSNLEDSKIFYLFKTLIKVTGLVL